MNDRKINQRRKHSQLNNGKQTSMIYDLPVTFLHPLDVPISISDGRILCI